MSPSGTWKVVRWAPLKLLPAHFAVRIAGQDSSDGEDDEEDEDGPGSGDDDDHLGEEDEREQDFDESWGQDKSAYYDADVGDEGSADTDEEEEEEEEIKRMQAKKRQVISHSCALVCPVCVADERLRCVM